MEIVSALLTAVRGRDCVVDLGQGVVRLWRYVLANALVEEFNLERGL